MSNRALFRTTSFAFAAIGLLATAAEVSAAIPRVRRMNQPTSMASKFANQPKSVPVANETINIAKIRQRLAKKNECGVTEVAPGVFIRLDCQQYTKVSKATMHLKMKAFRGGSSSATRIKPNGTPPAPPSTAGGNEVKSAGGGGFADSDADIAENFPETVDHRELGLEGPIKDQGAVGSCTAFALSTTMDNGLRRAGRAETVSPTHVWAGYGTPNMQDAGDSNLGRGITAFEVLPYASKDACKLARSQWEECSSFLDVQKNSWKSDAKLVAALDNADKNVKVRIANIESLQTMPAEPSELLEVLASGSDIWAAFKIDGYAWKNSSMKNAVIPDWTIPSGGHAVTVAGYRKTPRGREYLIHNSWGVKWGDGGYAWISENMVKKFMMFAYRVKLDGDDVKPVELTDDDCAGDELVDSVTKKCAKICADDSRPANGKCPK
jgi:Papain family cysteine protease